MASSAHSNIFTNKVSEKRGQNLGIVQPEIYEIPGAFELESGKTLSNVRLEYEVYGQMNAEKNNVILVCHALTGDAHAAGFHEGDTKPGWWNSLIGPNKAFDTEKYCIICSNVLGSCKGTTGPCSKNPETGKNYGMSFPVITIGDMVKAQKELISYLGIKQLFAVAGGSMGGMQVLQWTVSYPEMVKKAIAIATTATTTPQQIAFGAIGRKAIIDDPNWNGGNYYGKEIPVQGLSLARMIGHITYLSDASMQKKFGRNRQEKAEIDLCSEFQVESYLNHQGDTFTKRFDANSYIYITKAVDLFDLSKNGSLIEGFSGARAEYLVISISSDWLYPPYQSQEIVSALAANGVEATYEEIRSQYGHDAFLLEDGQLNYLIRGFLSQIFVKDLMHREFYSISKNETIETASKLMIKKRVNHLPVVSEDGRLEGIVTSWDITKAVACKINELEEIITKDVRYVFEDERIETASSIMEKYSISALPVVDTYNRVIGILTSEGISSLIGRSG